MIRRIIDICLALALLALCAPILALCAALIRRDGAGSVLYIPAVVGQGGRLFPLLRFRTMRAGNSNTPPEMRLTPVGRMLRTYSLDHLPMLFNLLIGDLTLIGPRPMERDVVDPRDPIWRAYSRLTPGVINYAIVNLGREWTPSRQKRPELNQALELEYARRRSLQSDLLLAARACREFLTSQGNLKLRKPPDADVAD